MDVQVIDGCQLEWDNARGVLYVHSGADGSTALRISGLHKNVPGPIEFGNGIDISISPVIADKSSPVGGIRIQPEPSVLVRYPSVKPHTDGRELVFKDSVRVK